MGLENDVVQRVGAATAALIKEGEQTVVAPRANSVSFLGKKAPVSAKKFSFVGVFIQFYRLFVTTKHLFSLLH